MISLNNGQLKQCLPPQPTVHPTLRFMTISQPCRRATRQCRLRPQKPSMRGRSLAATQAAQCRLSLIWMCLLARWTAFRHRPRNELALSIRHLVTKQAWFEVFIMICIIAVGVTTGLELDDPANMVRQACLLCGVLLSCSCEGSLPRCLHPAVARLIISLIIPRRRWKFLA